MSIYNAITSCAALYRQGPEVVHSHGVVEVFAMPHEDAIDPDHVIVDMHFVKVAVDAAKAEAVSDEIVAWCDEHPMMGPGPSYIAIGGELGSQDLALLLMAVGQVLGMWEVVTPERLGLSGADADKAAGAGYVMTTGYSHT